MCLSKAYIDRNGSTELVMEEITSVEIDEGKLLLRTLFGEQREVAASIKHINFANHSILLEPTKEEGVSLKDR
ncbi:CooT family nickel-binding protein [Chloroflexota bacterium]